MNGKLTMHIKHHLTEELLMGYSAGTLPEAFNIVVASHISLCDECRAALAEYDAVGGEVIATSDATVMAEDSLEATLAKITAEPMVTDVKAPAVESGLFPAPLREYVAGDVDAVKWRKVGGGAAMPDHGHKGTELTLVLQGAFADDHDHFAAGDVEVANEDLTHTPVAAEGEDCICLAATDAPLQFNGIIPRIAQKFMRI